jgi:Arc/MetJ family transcription regulator
VIDHLLTALALTALATTLDRAAAHLAADTALREMDRDLAEWQKRAGVAS